MQGYRRRTLRRPIEGRDLGVFSGRQVHFRLEPAPPGTGIVALPAGGDDAVPLSIHLACEVQNCSSVRKNGHRILVTEHLLAALHGFGITDVLIRMDGIEFPMFDGSALPYVQLIQEAGIEVYQEILEPIRVTEPVWLIEEGRILGALPYDGLKVSYTLDYAHPMLGLDFVRFDAEVDSFAEELAPARTFITIEEWYQIQRAGVLRAGSTQNAIVVFQDGLSSPLRMPNEFARHKALDILGDLYLLNRPIEAEIIAYRTGHTQNRRLALALLAQQETPRAQREAELPVAVSAVT